MVWLVGCSVGFSGVLVGCFAASIYFPAWWFAWLYYDCFLVSTFCYRVVLLCLGVGLSLRKRLGMAWVFASWGWLCCGCLALLN